MCGNNLPVQPRQTECRQTGQSWLAGPGLIPTCVRHHVLHPPVCGPSGPTSCAPHMPRRRQGRAAVLRGAGRAAGLQGQGAQAAPLLAHSTQSIAHTLHWPAGAAAQAAAVTPLRTLLVTGSCRVSLLCCLVGCSVTSCPPCPPSLPRPAAARRPVHVQGRRQAGQGQCALLAAVGHV